MSRISMFTVASSFRRWKRAEKGVAEIYSAIIILPIMVSLIFLLLEAGVNLQYRSNVDSIVQDAVRGISLDGGDLNPRTSTTNVAWSARAEQALIVLCGGNGTYPSGRCTARPDMSCMGVAGGPIAQGTPFSCTATFSYRPVSSLSSNPYYSFGMSQLLTKPFSIKVNSTISGGA